MAEKQSTPGDAIVTPGNAIVGITAFALLAVGAVSTFFGLVLVPAK